MIALHRILSADASPSARGPVAIDGAKPISFDTFRARVASLAAGFSALPRRVALCIDDPYAFACALFALFVTNREPVIPANATPGYLAGLANAYDALLRDADLHDAALAENTALSIDPLAPLTLYTSGSSGTPKAIAKTLAQFDAEVRTLEAEWGAQLGGATVQASVPHHHIYGLLFRVFWPLAAGRPFDRATCADPSELQARLDACGAQNSVAVVSSPAHLARWPALDGFDRLSPPPRAFFSSGGPLAHDAALRYAERFGAAPIEIFGSTETGGIAWRRQDARTAWRLLTGVHARRDETGALCVRSPHLGHDQWHVTDDAARFDDDGCFELLGRLDRVVKLDGKRVSLAELEACLARHACVEAAALVTLPAKDEASRDRLGAVIALSEEGAACWRDEGRNALAARLRQHLAQYADAAVLPRRWRFRVALPFDTRGKLPAAALAAEFAARANGPEVLAEVRIGGTIAFDLRVPPQLVHFAGHFPGLPILPGVVQVDWAIGFAAAHVPDVRAVMSIDRLKFLAPVRPGALLRLTLKPDAGQARVQFQYRLDGADAARDCASGVIAYRSAGA